MRPGHMTGGWNQQASENMVQVRMNHLIAEWNKKNKTNSIGTPRREMDLGAPRAISKRPRDRRRRVFLTQPNSPCRVLVAHERRLGIA